MTSSLGGSSGRSKQYDAAGLTQPAAPTTPASSSNSGGGTDGTSSEIVSAAAVTFANLATPTTPGLALFLLLPDRVAAPAVHLLRLVDR